MYHLLTSLFICGGLLVGHQVTPYTIQTGNVTSTLLTNEPTTTWPYKNTTPSTAPKTSSTTWPWYYRATTFTTPRSESTTWPWYYRATTTTTPRSESTTWPWYYRATTTTTPRSTSTTWPWYYTARTITPRSEATTWYHTSTQAPTTAKTPSTTPAPSTASTTTPTPTWYWYTEATTTASPSPSTPAPTTSTTPAPTTSTHYIISKVRLVYGDGPWAGKLEVFSGGRWGRVCDAYWNDKAAQVVCKMLRYSPEHAKAHPSSRFGADQVGLTFIARDFTCSGSEMSLTECSYSSNGFGQCLYYHDVGVDCFHSQEVTTDLPTTSPSPESKLYKATTVTCDDKAFNVSVDTSQLQMFGSMTGRYNHITLGTHGCTGHLIGDILHIYAPISDCVDHVQENASVVYYIGKLRLYHKEVQGEITRDHVTEVDVECTLRRYLTVDGSYVVEEKSKRSKNTAIIQAQAEFNTTMEFFTDQYFHHRIDWPHTVGLDQTLYVQLSVDSTDPELSLMVQNCRAHDKTYGKTYMLIRDRCPVDETTVILPSGKDFARFKFSSFVFIDKAPEVYINCDVTVCEPHDQSAWCYSRSCDGRSATTPMSIRSRLRALASVRLQIPDRRYVHLSAGPLYIKTDHEEVGRSSAGEDRK